MRLIFVHGWSVTNTDTYGELPAALSAVAANYGLELSIQHLYLGKYVSFHDEGECPTGSRKSAAMVNTSYPTFGASAINCCCSTPISF